MAITTTNPATGETVREFDSLTSEQLEDKIQRSWEAFQAYRDTTFEQRAGWMRAAADILDAEVDQLAELGHARDGEDPRRGEGRGRASARWAAAGTPTTPPSTSPTTPWDPADAPEDARVFTRYQPIGSGPGGHAVEFPYWQASVSLCPTLVAGNVGLLKHASKCHCGTAIAIQDSGRTSRISRRSCSKPWYSPITSMVE